MPELPAAGGELDLPADSVHHARVLRLGPGAEVELFDARSGQADATLIAAPRDVIRCRVGPRRTVAPPATELRLVLGLPKGSKLEAVVRMLTELGVDGVHLALTERSVPRPGDREAAARLARLRRIALEACAQSGQPRAPELHPPAPLLEIAGIAPAYLQRLVFWERATAPWQGLSEQGRSRGVWAVIGPEGGLSDAEVAGLSALGFSPVGLGPARLRVETAGPAIAALILAQLGRFGA